MRSGQGGKRKNINERNGKTEKEERL